MSIKKPLILDFAGLDPSGGAGLQADIETVFQLGGSVLPILTTQTIQNTQRFLDTQATPSGWLKRQVKHLLQDISPNVIKIGLTTTGDTLLSISELLNVELSNLPLIVDPVLRSGSGQNISDQELMSIYRTHIFPYADIITPNRYEARQLTHEDDLEAAAKSLIQLGTRFVLITGADEASGRVQNDLYGGSGLIERYPCPKLPHTYHGSGCTLSAAISVFIAQGFSPRVSVEKALDFTWRSLDQAFQSGQMQWHPNRQVEP